MFVYLRNDERARRASSTTRSRRSAEAGHPTLTLAIHGAADLGRMFFLAEFATAVAGWVLEINPFDQPNVQEAKDATKRVLEPPGRCRSSPPADDEALRALLGDAGPPHYIAMMGYLAASDELDEAVGELRAAIRDATGAATTFGYGPRFLHSTGQLHKGGPPDGALPAARPTSRTGRGDPGRRLLVRDAEGRAGRRRPADAARATACRPSASRSTAIRRPRCGALTRADHAAYSPREEVS